MTTAMMLTGAASAGGGFTDPSSIATCKIWCESDTGLFSDSAGTTPQASNGGTVKHWTNRLGSNNLTRAAGNAPTLDTGTTLNGLSALHFTSGTLQCLDFPNFFTGDTAGEMLAVLKMDADPAASSPSSGFMFLGNSNFATAYPFTDGNIYDGFGTSARRTVGNIAQSLASAHVYNPNTNSSEWNLRVNNTVVFGPSSPNTVQWTTAPLLGVSSASGAFTGSEMRVWAVYYFNSVLTSGERANMYAWILAKYGI